MVVVMIGREGGGGDREKVSVGVYHVLGEEGGGREKDKR